MLTKEQIITMISNGEIDGAARCVAPSKDTGWKAFMFYGVVSQINIDALDFYQQESNTWISTQNPHLILRENSWLVKKGEIFSVM